MVFGCPGNPNATRRRPRRHQTTNAAQSHVHVAAHGHRLHLTPASAALLDLGEGRPAPEPAVEPAAAVAGWRASAARRMALPSVSLLLAARAAYHLTPPRHGGDPASPCLPLSRCCLHSGCPSPAQGGHGGSLSALPACLCGRSHHRPGAPLAPAAALGGRPGPRGAEGGRGSAAQRGWASTQGAWAALGGRSGQGE